MPKLTPIQFVPSTPSFLASAPDKPRTVPEERFVGMVIQKDLEIAEIRKLSEARAAHDQSTIVMLHRLVAKLEAEVTDLKKKKPSQAENQGVTPIEASDPYVVPLPCQGFGNPDPAPIKVTFNTAPPPKPPMPANAINHGPMKIGTFLP
jgi:hypothetical protein